MYDVSAVTKRHFGVKIGDVSLNVEPPKLIADYVSTSVLEVYEFDYDLCLLLARDAVIFNCSQTESGKDYLEKCFIFEQTEPDRQSLRAHFEG